LKGITGPDAFAWFAAASTGRLEEGDEEQAYAGKQQVQQALQDNAQDTQRHRRDHQQHKKEDSHPILRSTELLGGGQPLSPQASGSHRLLRSSLMVRSKIAKP
jgi:hypothetical protein